MVVRRRLTASLSAAALCATLAACGRDSANKGIIARSLEVVAGSAKAAGRPHVAARTATEPADPCGWIPVSEVEAIVGTLAGPPEPVDGCTYRLALPEPVRAARQDTVTERRRLEEKLKAAFKDYEPPQLGGVWAGFERDPRNYTISLAVSLDGNMAGELGAAAGFRQLRSWLPSEPGAPQEAPPAPTAPTRAGWDAEIALPSAFMGRLGHMAITVTGGAPDVPEEPMRTLAERVRDRIPDLPFPVSHRYQTPLGGGPKSPCSLLTRAEAESVLGPLVVDPYLSSGDYPPRAHDAGYACAYFAAGHHTLVLHPAWDYGQQTMRMEKMTSGLMSIVMPQEPVTLTGPWDEARVSPATGALLLRKGDRLLTVHYLTSSTDRAGAVKLAALAMGRLAP